jgi:hypothetical protein
MSRTRGSTTAKSQTDSSLQPATEVMLTKVAPLAYVSGKIKMKTVDKQGSFEP